MLGLFQTHIRPGLSAVEAFIDAVAVSDVTAADVFARPDPDDLGIDGVQRQAADGIRRLAVEDRRPGRPGVFRFPDAARTDGHIPGRFSFGVDDDVADPAGHDCRPDVAEGQAGEKPGREKAGLFGRGRLVPGLSFLAEGDKRGEEQRERMSTAVFFMMSSRTKDVKKSRGRALEALSLRPGWP